MPELEEPVVADAPLNKFTTLDATSGTARTLEFRAVDTKRNLNLVLVFETPTIGAPYLHVFPVVWKIISLGSVGVNIASVTYTGASSFFVPQIRQDKFISAINYQTCEVGKKCEYKTNDDGSMPYISPAGDGAPGVIQCVNTTSKPVNIGIGFLGDDGFSMEPTVLYKGLLNSSILSVPLNTTLKIYASTKYKVSEVLKGDIDGPILFSKVLSDLAPTTNYSVTVDPGTGEIGINDITP